MADHLLDRLVGFRTIEESQVRMTVEFPRWMPTGWRRETSKLLAEYLASKHSHHVLCGFSPESRRVVFDWSGEYV